MDAIVPGRAIRHLRTLCKEIGPRPGGSIGNRAAAAYIESVFRSCGMAVEVQEFTCPVWEELGAWLCLEDAALPIAANPFSPSCLVAAPIAPLASLAELETAELEGKLAVLHGEWVRSPLAPKAWPYKSAEEARLVELLEQKRPAAVLTVYAYPGEVERLIEDPDFLAPSATVSAEIGALLLERAGEMARVRIDARRTEGVTANVIGRLPGALRRQIVISAHYDTKVDTPGAGDNAAGVAVLLTLAEQLCRLERLYSLEFVAFTNEEYLPPGHAEYVRRRGEPFEQIAAALHFDGVGLCAGPNTVAGFHLTDDLQRVVEQVMRQFPEVLWAEPWPQSCHMAFVQRGVPTLAFTAQVERPHFHLPSDTIYTISPERLEEMVSFGCNFIQVLETREGAPV